MITIAEAKMKVPDRASFWKGLERQGFRMPALKARICTNDFLTDVRQGHVYCLTYADLKVRSCVSMPPQKVLQEMAVGYIAQRLTDPGPDLTDAEKREYNRWVALHSYLTKYTADAAWLKDLLSTHFPTAVIFETNYE